MNSPINNMRSLLRKIRHRLFQKSKRKVFTEIYRKKVWQAEGTVSGPGSTIAKTAALRVTLPKLLNELGVRSLIDAPCGDYNWMSKTDLATINYTGIDIVPELIEENRKRYPGVKFLLADIVTDKLPVADAALSRDCFIHLTNKQIIAAIANFKKSGIKYLITNTYPVDENVDIITGYYRPVNLEIKPFNLPSPIKRIDDYLPGTPEKWLGVWAL